MHTELPAVTTINAQKDGPTVAILGGVHGDEYEGVIAATTLARSLQSELISGRIRIASPAHPAAWKSGTRESPIDGANLARVFPGSTGGSATEQVAYALTEQVIRGADLLIDLHSAGTNFEMPFLCGFHGGPHRWTAESQRLANIFGADFTWRHDGIPAAGRSLTVAYDFKIPAIYVEGHGGRSIRRSDLQGYLDGVRRLLHELNMLTTRPSLATKSIRVCGEGNTDKGVTAPAAGFLVTRVEAGDHVFSDDLIAEIIDGSGNVITKLHAAHDSYIMLRRRDAQVFLGDTVFIMAIKEDDFQ